MPFHQIISAVIDCNFIIDIESDLNYFKIARFFEILPLLGIFSWLWYALWYALAYGG